jgi:hypothetical protein
MHWANRQTSNACLLLNQMAKRRMENLPDEHIYRGAIHGVAVVLLNNRHSFPMPDALGKN